MSKKNKNIILGLVIAFFVLLALLFSENSSKIVSFSDNVEDEVGQVKKEVFTFTSPDEVSEEAEYVEDSEEQGGISASTYKVTRVIDGDTIEVLVDGKKEKVRLIGIDTPESVNTRTGIECFGKEASKKTKDLLLGQQVILESDDSQSDKDRYGRLLRFVFLDDGTNFNLLLIKEGYAFEYTYDDKYKYQQEFKDAEDAARIGQIGLWSPQNCSQ